MTTPSIQDARGVHVGLFASLLFLYPLLPMIGVAVLLTQKPEAVVGWVLAVSGLYLPLPFITLAWIFAVRARIGLSQPVKAIRSPLSVLCVAGGSGLVLVAAIHGMLSWLVWHSAAAITWPAVMITALGAGFLLLSMWSLLRTLRWARLWQTPIAA
jgi:hypothetical protein